MHAKEDDELSQAASSVCSNGSFRSLNTRKVKPSLLNQKAYAQIYVAE